MKLKRVIVLLVLCLSFVLFSNNALAESFSDNFNRADNTNLGVNWTEFAGTSSNAEILSNQVRFTDTSTSGTGYVYIYHDFTEYLTSFNISFDISQTTNTQWFVLELRDDSTRKIRLDLGHAGFFANLNSSSGFQNVQAQATSTTYNIEMAYYNTTHYNLCIDSLCYILEANDVINNGINNVSFSTASSSYSSGNTYLDNFIGENMATEILSATAINEYNNPLSNFTISIYDGSSLIGSNTTSTTTASINMSYVGLTNGNYTLTFTKPGYLTVSEAFEYISPESISIQFESTRVPSIDITFKNMTDDLINYETVYYEIIGDNFSTSTSTSNGTIFLYLGGAGDYVSRYWTNPDYKRRYDFNIAAEANEAITLYVDNEGENITATIYDEYLNVLEGAILIVQKYNIEIGSYVIIDRLSTNFQGNANFIATLNDDFYKFLIYYDDTLVFTSNPTLLTSDAITFKVVTTTSTAQGFYNSLDLDYSLVFNNDTNNFRFTYADNDGLTTSVKLKTVRVTQNGVSVVNETISTASSGTILHNVQNITNYHYTSCAYAYTEGEYELLNCAYAHFGENDLPEAANKLALFILILIMMVLALAAYFDIIISLIIVPLPWILFEIIGLTQIGLAIAISVEILMVIVALVIGSRR